jgi:uncharacterized damage-inducible protein DinB
VARAAAKRLTRQGSRQRSAATSRSAKPRVTRGKAKPRAGDPKPARRAKPAAKPARKRVARKAVARKAVARRAVARKLVAQKAVARTAPGRKPARATAKRPALPVAKRPTQRAAAAPRTPAAPAFAVQRAAATSRELLLFELQRARASVKAAIQGLSSGAAMQPIAPGKWSAFEIVLHLSERDRVRLEEFARTLAGQPRTWAGIHDPEMAPVNEAHLAPLRAHTWDEAVRRLDSLREELLQRLFQVPAQPDDVWQRGHAFGDMMWGLPDHDRHHAEQIKRVRIGDLVPVED